MVDQILPRVAGNFFADLGHLWLSRANGRYRPCALSGQKYRPIDPRIEQMPETSPQTDHGAMLERCDEHFRTADWKAGRELAQQVLAESPELPEALERLARAERWFDNLDAAFAARERAFAAYRARGDDAAAGMVASLLAYDNFLARNEPAVANGWFARAHDVLDPLGTTAALGWLHYREAQFSHFSDHDLANMLALLGEAGTIARDTGDTLLATMVTSLTGFVEVCIGDVESGMRKLDMAGTAVIAGEIEMLELAGVICCDLIYACEQVRDVERARQWLRAAEQISDEGQFTPLLGVCHVHFARLLMWEGDWPGAEREFERAREAIETSGRGLVVDHALRLAELRRLQGRLDEAWEVCAELEWLPGARLGQAQIAHARGDDDLARDLLHRCMRGAGEADRMTVADACALCVEIEIIRGDIDAAKDAAQQLRDHAALVQTDHAEAAALLAEGRVAAATGDLLTSRMAIESAIDLWMRRRAPYEAAQARIALASVLEKLGDTAQAAAERDRADKILAELSTAASSGSEESGLLTNRELEVLRLVAEGRSDDEIAERLVISPHTVHRHVANIRNKLDEPSRAAAVAHASRAGLL